MSRILAGAVAGLILGLIEMMIFSGGWDLIVFPALLGALIGFVSTRMNSVGLLGLGAVFGALVFLVSAMLSGWKLLDHSITGAITGFLISVILKFVVPQIPFLNSNNS